MNFKSIQIKLDSSAKCGDLRLLLHCVPFNVIILTQLYSILLNINWEKVYV